MPLNYAWDLLTFTSYLPIPRTFTISCKFLICLSFSFCCLVSTAIQASATKYHRLGGLQTTDIYFSQFQRKEVQDLDVNMVQSGSLLHYRLLTLSSFGGID